MTLRTLPVMTALRVFFRSLTMQASFSPEKLQTLGLLYALMPALEYLYPDPAEQKRAVERYLQPFNTQPYMATGLAGTFVHQEERIAAGEAKPESVAELRTALAGPLAAVGDGFFWLSLRPAAAVIALAFMTLPSAAGGFFLIYSSVHLTVRLYVFRIGYRDGAGIVTAVGRLAFQSVGHRLRLVAAFALGVVAASAALTTPLPNRAVLLVLIPAATIISRIPTLAALYGAGLAALLFAAFT